MTVVHEPCVGLLTSRWRARSSVLGLALKSRGTSGARECLCKRRASTLGLILNGLSIRLIARSRQPVVSNGARDREQRLPVCLPLQMRSNARQDFEHSYDHQDTTRTILTDTVEAGVGDAAEVDMAAHDSHHTTSIGVLLRLRRCVNESFGSAHPCRHAGKACASPA